MSVQYPLGCPQSLDTHMQKVQTHFRVISEHVSPKLHTLLHFICQRKIQTRLEQGIQFTQYH